MTQTIVAHVAMVMINVSVFSRELKIVHVHAAADEH